jgi:hypothetical protein
VKIRWIIGCFVGLASGMTVDHAANVLPARAGSMCSLMAFAGVRFAGLYFVGTTMTDTMLAGLGPVKPTQYGGHWGSGRAREVYGQLVRVELLSAEAPAELRNVMAGDRTIVVVPWDYDPACDPTYWSRSAAWVEAGLEGFYTVRLRPQGRGENSRPVADAFFADLQPYPHGPFYHAGYRGTSALRERASLTAREYFSLYAVLPTPSELRDGSSAALSRLQTWKAQHPDLAERYPADQIIAVIRRRAR